MSIKNSLIASTLLGYLKMQKEAKVALEVYNAT